MGAFRTRTWILLASLVASLHAAPGVHELSHDAAPHEANHAAEVSTIEVECEVCALLSGTRHGIFSTATQTTQSQQAILRLDHPPTGGPIVARGVTPASPRAPPAA